LWIFENIVKKDLRESLEKLSSSKEFRKFFKENSIETIKIEYTPDGMVKSRTSISDIKEGKKKDFGIIKNIVSWNIRKNIEDFLREYSEPNAIPKQEDFADILDKKSFNEKSLKELSLIAFLKSKGIKKIKILFNTAITAIVSNGKKSKQDNEKVKKLVEKKFDHIVLWSLPPNFSNTKFEINEKRIKDEYGCTFEFPKGKNFVLQNVFKTFAGRFSTNGVIDYNKLKPHPASKLLFKARTGDAVRCLNGNGVTETFKLLAGNLWLVKINNAKPSIYPPSYDDTITLSNLKARQFRPVHVDILGNVKDNNKWFEKE
jgi:hypothetical protein